MPLGQQGHVAMVGQYPVFDVSPKKKITGRNVKGPRGPQQQWLVISRRTPYSTSW